MQHKISIELHTHVPEITDIYAASIANRENTHKKSEHRCCKDNHTYVIINMDSFKQKV